MSVDPPGLEPAPEPEPSAERSPDGGPTAEKLRAYVDANAGRYTDEALTAELIRAGYPPDDVRASLAEAAGRGLERPPTGRAAMTILAAYGITFLVLSLGMVANHGTANGEFMPTASGGIQILATSLGLTFVASLVWIASRRLFAVGIGALVALAGLGGISTFAGLAAIAIGVGIIILAVRTRPSTAVGPPATLGALLVVPVLLLLVVGGICVASGLPIPRPG
jgi:hypothetical protein